MSAVKLAQFLEEDDEGLPRDLERAAEVFELSVELAKEKIPQAVCNFGNFLLE